MNWHSTFIMYSGTFSCRCCVLLLLNKFAKNKISLRIVQLQKDEKNKQTERQTKLQYFTFVCQHKPYELLNCLTTAANVVFMLNHIKTKRNETKCKYL